MTYLDDATHEWVLESDRKIGLNEIIHDMDKRDMTEEEIALVLRGYVGLKVTHPDASDAQCLDTSMVWLYG